MQATVNNIHCTGSWNSQHGLRYNILVSLSDGTVGQASAISEAPWYAAQGTLVDYEIQEGLTPQGHKKLKISKPEGQAGGYQQPAATQGSGPAAPASVVHGATVGMAMKVASDLICADKVALDTNKRISHQVYDLAKALINTSLKLERGEPYDGPARQQQAPPPPPPPPPPAQQAETPVEDYEEDVPF